MGGAFLTRTDTDRFRTVVLKSTGSAFENFVRDEYTTLVEVDDRIFSTSVDLRYTYGEVGVKLCPRGGHEDSGGRKGLGVFNFGEENFDKNGSGAVHPWEDAKVGARARETTLDVFAHDESASVQVRRMRGNGGLSLPITLSFSRATGHWDHS
jgi:urate oxidase